LKTDERIELGNSESWGNSLWNDRRSKPLFEEYLLKMSRSSFAWVEPNRSSKVIRAPMFEMLLRAENVFLLLDAHDPIMGKFNEGLINLYLNLDF
jgi:hypothetical protein